MNNRWRPEVNVKVSPKMRLLPAIASSLLFISVLLIYNILFDFLLVILLCATGYLVGTWARGGHLPFVDRFFLRMASGLGGVGIFIWICVTAGFPTPSIFLFACLALFLFRFKKLRSLSRNTAHYIGKTFTRAPFIFSIYCAIFCFYLVVASAPIDQTNFDSLAKHVAIPIKMLEKSGWDYNVVESAPFGDSSLLAHMFWTFLLSLGGKKAIVIFVATVSFLSAAVLSRIASRISRSSFASIITALIFLSTPLVLLLSTVLYVDIIPLFFFLVSVLVISSEEGNAVLENSIPLAIVLGASIFSKQTAAFFVVPVSLVILGTIIFLVIMKQARPIRAGALIIISIIVGAAVFLPSMLVVWHKTGNPFFPFLSQIFSSPYSPGDVFRDPFTNELGINLRSLLSMVYHTSQNVELPDGGLGNYLILLLATPALLLFKTERKRSLVILFIIIAGYFFITRMAYNIRYILPILTLAIVPVSLLLSRIRRFFKNALMKKTAGILIVCLLVFPNLYYIFFTGERKMFRMEFLHPDGRLVDNPNSSVLDYIDDPTVRVLSLNDVFRGMFSGEFYTISRYSMITTYGLESGEVGPTDFIKNFDYLLVDKQKPFLNYTDATLIDPYNPTTRELLTVFMESETHILYAVKKDAITLFSKTFKQGLVLTGDMTVDVGEFAIADVDIVLYLEAEPSSPVETPLITVDIAWFDEDGHNIGTTSFPLAIYAEKRHFLVPISREFPSRSRRGVVTLAGNGGADAVVFSCAGLKEKRHPYIDDILTEYDKTWPHLLRRSKRQ